MLGLTSDSQLVPLLPIGTDLFVLNVSSSVYLFTPYTSLGVLSNYSDLFDLCIIEKESKKLRTKSRYIQDWDSTQLPPVKLQRITILRMKLFRNLKNKTWRLEKQVNGSVGRWYRLVWISDWFGKTLINLTDVPDDLFRHHKIIVVHIYVRSLVLLMLTL